jgi:hypothetical protein
MLHPSHTGAGTSATVGTSAALLVAGRTLRKSILIQNAHGSNKLYVGVASTVTTSSGIRLDPDNSIEFTDYLGPIYAIADGASTDVRYLEIGG